ncbi:glycosyltransferase 87 family protein [Streptomyces halobius]|uniref:Glycosyltransferase 87 family protein n=1 Tax=Streptomyces halobius TaxID=2879846 RepID=A0ABY4MLG3_9ACTN|nr:glycosyltransferase 87 family protein [Streptomyces halobius]UQA98027.1 glycosyltransferase 87 family protein [Streptomyces halobius]
MHLPVVVWAATRAVLLLCVTKVLVLPGPDVTSDISVIYQGWYEILKTGTFPLDDVTWQYPPAAALPVLGPGLLPFLDYTPAFFTLVLVVDAAGLALFLRAGRRPGNRPLGAWVWIVGVALLGPTAYARYDLMVTAVAVAALFAAARRPRVAGALVAFGALLKVWPVLLLCGAACPSPRRRRARALWLSATGTAAGLTVFFVAVAPGALAFVTFQRDRGTEIESLGALVFHIARHFGWSGEVLLNYGSVEFLGPGVPLVSALALALSLTALGWLLLWRLRAREFGAATLCDAAFTATLLFTTTSRVISPQYMLWLVGLAGVCMTVRASRQALPTVLVLLATGVTLLEFPVSFTHVVASDLRGVALLALRNGLLVAASLIACRRLWAATGAGRPGNTSGRGGGTERDAVIAQRGPAEAALTSAPPSRPSAAPAHKPATDA